MNANTIGKKKGDTVTVVNVSTLVMIYIHMFSLIKRKHNGMLTKIFTT